MLIIISVRSIADRLLIKSTKGFRKLQFTFATISLATYVDERN